MSIALESAAWGTLGDAWLLHWVIVFFAGILPAEVLGRVRHFQRLQWAQWGRRLCAGAVAILCISRVPLALDTYFVESKDPRAFASLPCESQGPGELVCNKAGRMVRLAYPPRQPFQQGSGTAHVLAHDGAVVWFEVSATVEGN